MAIKTFKRVEEKYILNETQYAALLPRLAEYMHEDTYCKDGALYTVYNIYYDTTDNAVITHSLGHPYYKEKLRLRSYYVPTSGEDNVYLELKKKIGGVVSKRRAGMTLQDAADFIELGVKPTAESYLDRQVIEEIAFYLSQTPVRPTAYISYDRLALFGKDNPDFRVTFDTNILGRRTNLKLCRTGEETRIIPRHTYVCEIKILGAIPLWLSEVLSENSIFSSGFSKYGMEYRQYLAAEQESFKKVI